MNIVMMTNTYSPFVGGVERSVSRCTELYRDEGHRVLVIAPEYEGRPEHEEDVVRVPAIQHFNSTDFSVRLPIPGYLSGTVKDFGPDIIHSHHPFLLGDTAVRISAKSGKPLVFTFHTFYEKYTHYAPGNSEPVKQFIKNLSVRYANLCGRVFAPSESVRDELEKRGVVSPMKVIPTGVDTERFKNGNGAAFRESAGIPDDTFVAGFVSRIEPEKNIGFLSKAVISFLQHNENSRFIAVGSGSSEEYMKTLFRAAGLKDRFHACGTMEGEELCSAYSAMDVFAFASHTETQGLVLGEAMSAGVPVVAVDAAGVREIVNDGANGILLEKDDTGAFAKALETIKHLDPEQRAGYKRNARETAEEYSDRRCAARALQEYEEVIDEYMRGRSTDYGAWEKLKNMASAEWDLLKNKTGATVSAVENVILSGDTDEE